MHAIIMASNVLYFKRYYPVLERRRLLRYREGYSCTFRKYALWTYVLTAR